MRAASPIENHVLPGPRLDRIVRSAEVAAGWKQTACLAHAAPVTVRRTATARAMPEDLRLLGVERPLHCRRPA